MKKIIFDLDNTLLYLSDDWISHLQLFFNKSDINVEPLTLFGAIAKCEEVMADVIITKKDLTKYLEKVLAINVDDMVISDIFDCYNNIPLEYTEEIYKLLSYLSEKYELIVYTNWFKEDQIKRLNKYGLDHFFSNIYGWDIIPAKPSLKGLQTIVKDDDPTNFIFVGDNIKTDLEIPFEMGMNTIFLNSKGIEQSKYKEIKTIEELQKFL